MGWAIIIGVAILLFMFLSRGLDDRTQLSPGEFWTSVREGYVKSGSVIVIKETEIQGELAPNAPLLEADDSPKFTVAYKYEAESNFDERLQEALGRHDTGVRYRYEPSGWWSGVLPHLLITVVVFLAIWFLLFRRIGSGAGGGGFLGNFGRSKHRVVTKEQSRVTFEDVAGVSEAKDEVTELIEFLKNPRKFQRLGGRVPRGVLLVGPPGCGKTLLAKAIAGEAEVPFFSISGSDFVEMFVGVGASRVRDLFKQAKDSAPCIIFLDEIDAVGRKRGVGFGGGGHDEREQTLNAILVEMDGMDSSDQVIVIAATNRQDVLDPALTRPGRFDRQIQVALPDLEGRYHILKIYTDKVKCGPDVDLHRIARGTPMFSGADLAALVNEAAISATMTNKDYIEQVDLEEARDKVRWGRARKSRVVDEQEKQTTAYHEAGHALVQVLTPDADPLHKVSIIPRGAAGGATFTLPEKDRYLYTRRYCRALLTVLLGGRVAEELFCDDVSSGAAGDIHQATEIARKMVLDWGMSERLGYVRYNGSDQQQMAPMMGDFNSREYSDKTAEVIDEEIRKFIDAGYRNARHLAETHRQQLQNLADALIKYETLSGQDVQRIVEGQTIEKPTVGELLEKEHAKEQQDASAADDESSPTTETDGGALPEPG
ncbi:MAG: ATP-dependent zinc metalloprotease FtsH [Phycisphaerae bacterium]